MTLSIHTHLYTYQLLPFPMLLFRLLFCKSSIYISLVLVNPNLKLLYIDNHNSRFYFQKSSTGIKISTIKYNKINFFYLQGDCGKSVFPGAGQVCRPPGDQLECRQRRPGEGDDLSREIETGSWFIILNISELLPTAACSYHQTPGHGHHVTSSEVRRNTENRNNLFLESVLVQLRLLTKTRRLYQMFHHQKVSFFM